MSYSIAELNQMSQSAFVEALGSVFENTPSIAERTWEKRPFTDLISLHETMVAMMRSLSTGEQLALIRTHPDLGSRVRMADASVREQAQIGLDRLLPQEYLRFQQLNQAYRDKFGFPFIIAVRKHTKTTILQAFDRRLHNSLDTEIKQALIEIAQIAEFRLRDRVSNS